MHVLDTSATTPLPVPVISATTATRLATQPQRHCVTAD